VELDKQEGIQNFSFNIGKEKDNGECPLGKSCSENGGILTPLVLGVDTKGRPDRPPVIPEIKWTSQAQAEIDPNKPDHITSIGP
jgi:hypothetical protein